MTLNKVRRHDPARVSGFDSDPGNADLVESLRDIGLAEGDEVEIMQHGPIGATPLSVRLGGRLIALRKAEAALVHIVCE